MKLLLIITSVLVLLGAGYAGYTYLKQDPPDALVDAISKPEPAPLSAPKGTLAQLESPEGFTLSVFSDETPGARVLTRDPKGTLLVSLKEGKVVALPDFNSDGVVDEVRTVLEGLYQPHGILVHCPDTGFESADQDACTLYVAETNALKSYRYDADLMKADQMQTLAALPEAGGGHHTRTLLLHPDGQHLLISVGSSCNVCEETDPQRASVLSYNLTTKEITTFATGLRNTVFMAIDPVFGEIWGTDNGRDVIGDDIPPDEINILTQGNDYGWPYCYGEQVLDIDFRSNGDCSSTIPPHIALQAHSAALGLAFVPEEGWPEDMRSDLLVAYHGSWNRSEPTGYKVVRFDLSADSGREATSGAIDFLSGFLKTNDADDAVGRPVGILAEPGGVAYISDDHAGAIYRIVWQGE